MKKGLAKFAIVLPAVILICNLIIPSIIFAASGSVKLPDMASCIIVDSPGTTFNDFEPINFKQGSDFVYMSTGDTENNIEVNADSTDLDDSNVK